MLSQRVKEDNGILIGFLNLLEGQSDGKIKLLYKGVKDPLVENVKSQRGTAGPELKR